jgi:hypothetical protein
MRSILEELGRRMVDLGVTWDHATAINMYGAAGSPMDDVIGEFGTAALNGLTCFPSLPPIRDLQFEIDVRGVCTEIVL